MVRMSKTLTPDAADLTLKTYEQHVDLDIGELRYFGNSRLVLHNTIHENKKHVDLPRTLTSTFGPNKPQYNLVI